MSEANNEIESTATEDADNIQIPLSIWPKIPTEDFRAIDFEAPVRDLLNVHPHKLYESYSSAVHAAEAIEDERAVRVFTLLVGVTGIFLRPDDKANPWVPMFSGPGGTTAVPAVFRGEQSAAFAELLPDIVHPALRARLADIVWSNDRRVGTAANVAAIAYRDCVEGLVSGRFSSWIDQQGADLMEVISPLQRMLQIVHATSKKVKRPDWMSTTLEYVYDNAKRRSSFVPFVKSAELGLHYELLTELRVAIDAESIARSVTTNVYPMAVRGCWRLAVRLYERLKDAESARRCRLGALECTLAMRQQVLGSAGAEASWVMDALQELRHIPGMEAKQQQLELELRRLQRASVSQMQTIEMALEVDSEREIIEQLFSDLCLSDCLRRFAFLSPSPEPDVLRAQALELADQAPITALMPIKVVDDEGRTVVNVSGLPPTGVPDDS